MNSLANVLYLEFGVENEYEQSEDGEEGDGHESSSFSASTSSNLPYDIDVVLSVLQEADSIEEVVSSGVLYDVVNSSILKLNNVRELTHDEGSELANVLQSLPSCSLRDFVLGLIKFNGCFGVRKDEFEGLKLLHASASSYCVFASEALTTIALHDLYVMKVFTVADLADLNSFESATGKRLKKELKQMTLNATQGRLFSLAAAATERYVAHLAFYRLALNIFAGVRRAPVLGDFHIILRLVDFIWESQDEDDDMLEVDCGTFGRYFKHRYCFSEGEQHHLLAAAAISSQARANRFDTLLAQQSVMNRARFIYSSGSYYVNRGANDGDLGYKWMTSSEVKQALRDMYRSLAAIQKMHLDSKKRKYEDRVNAIDCRIETIDSTISKFEEAWAKEDTIAATVERNSKRRSRRLKK